MTNVVSENSTLMTSAVSKLFNTSNRIPHNSTNLQNRCWSFSTPDGTKHPTKGFISCTRFAWARKHEISELATYCRL